MTMYVLILTFWSEAWIWTVQWRLHIGRVVQVLGPRHPRPKITISRSHHFTHGHISQASANAANFTIVHSWDRKCKPRRLTASGSLETLETAGRTNHKWAPTAATTCIGWFEKPAPRPLQAVCYCCCYHSLQTAYGRFDLRICVYQVTPRQYATVW